MDLATIVRERHELASRTSGSVEITLFWDASDDSTSVEIWQPASEIRLRIAVARERPRRLLHPFTHLADASAVLPAAGG